MKKKSNSWFSWWVFTVCCLISIIGFGLLVNTIGLFFEPIGKAFKISRASVALMTSFQNLAAALTLLFAGKIIEKVNLKKSLSLCVLIIGLALIRLTYATQMLDFYLMWTIIGIAQPITVTLSIPLLLSRWFNEKLATVMGIALGVSALGGMVFNPVVTQVINAFGWRAGFTFEGLLFLVILLPCVLSLREQPDQNYSAYGHKISTKEETKQAVGINLRDAIKTKHFYLLAIPMIVLQYVSGSVQHTSAAVQTVGLSAISASLVVSAIMFGAAIGKISIGYFLDRFSHKLVTMIYCCLGFLGWLAMMSFNSPALLIGAGFVLGLGQGVVLVSLPIFIKQIFGQRDYANILSILSMIGSLAMAASVSLDGHFYDLTHAYTLPWLLNVVAYVIAAGCLFSILGKAQLDKEDKKVA